MLELAQLVRRLTRRGLPEPATEADRELVASVVSAIARPRFCGVAEHINIGGQQYGTWPERTLRYAIVGTHPMSPPAVWRRMIENALDRFHTTFELDYVETTDTREGACELLFTVANLGGRGGTLADALLVPPELERNRDFQSLIRADRHDTFVEELTGALLELLGVEVLTHELGHAHGAPHHDAPRSLLNAFYDPTIRGLQLADIALLERIGLRRRTAPLPPSGPPAPEPPPASPWGTRLLIAGQTYKAKKRAFVVEEL